jgi:hypothetical protein
MIPQVEQEFNTDAARFQAIDAKGPQECIPAGLATLSEVAA